MTQSPYQQVTEVEQVEQAMVVRFKRRTILEPAAIQAVGDQLLRLAGEGGHRNILLNFKGVESLTSGMLGEFVVLHKALSESGGRLAFCCVEPFLMQVFKVVKLPERIPIYDEEVLALQAMASEAHVSQNEPEA